MYPDYLYITITYITKLLMQYLPLNETCRMIYYSAVSLKQVTFDID